MGRLHVSLTSKPALSNRKFCAAQFRFSL